MRLDRKDGKRVFELTASEKKAIETVKSLCEDLNDLHVEGAEEAKAAVTKLAAAIEPVPADSQVTV